jgi:hypothetical protein
MQLLLLLCVAAASAASVRSGEFIILYFIFLHKQLSDFSSEDVDFIGLIILFCD